MNAFYAQVCGKVQQVDSIEKEDKEPKGYSGFDVMFKPFIMIF